MTPSLVNTTKQINTLNDHGANNSSSETQTFQTTENFYSNSKNVLKKKIKSTKIKTKKNFRKTKQNLTKSQNYKFLSILRLKELKHKKASRF